MKQNSRIITLESKTGVFMHLSDYTIENTYDAEQFLTYF